jgi:hypothetical protein
MNTALIHPAHDHHSRLPTISLLVAIAAAGLAVVSLAVAVNDDVTTIVPEVVPVEQGVDPAQATPRQSSIDRSPGARIRQRGDGCYVTPTGAVLC